MFRQAVDVSSLNWLLSTGARQAALRRIKTISECFADKFINAAKVQSNSYAIKKKGGFFSWGMVVSRESLNVNGCVLINE